MAGNITYETVDIELYRNDSYVWTFDVTDVDDVAVDMTGYTFNGEVRRSQDSVDVLADFRFVETNIATGELTAILDATEVGALEDSLPASLEGVYDIQIMSGDATPIVHTVRRGAVTFIEDVTRP
jgi:hypothetical protein